MSAPFSPSRRRAFVPAIAALLLLVFAGLCSHFATTTSPTFDEPDQVAVGYASLTQERHTYSVVNLRFSQIWAALPLLVFDPPPRFPDAAQQEEAAAQNISYGRLFYFSNGNDPDAILRASRLMIILLGLGLGLTLFLYSRRLHGDLAGLLTLTFYSLSPLVIANSAVATTEIATTLFFTLSVLALWRLLHRISLVNIALAGAAVGVLAATKISGLLIVPTTLVLLVIRLRGGRPITLKLPWKSEPSTQPSSWKLSLAAMCGVGVVAFITVWAIYGGPSAAPPAEPQKWSTHASLSDRLAPKVINLVRDCRFLPEAYLFDLHTFVNSGDIRRAFLLGQYSIDGWWYFFPVAWLVKNPLPFLLALAAALVAARRSGRLKPAEGGVDYYGLAPVLALGGVYGGFALLGNLNIGARHLLPLFPLALVFAGLAGRMPLADRRLRGVFLGVLFAGSALEAWLAHPHPLSYFNAFAGGPARGYRVLSDSSADWGEALPYVQSWKARRMTRPDAGPDVYFSYFGCADLAHYGIDARTTVLLPQFYDTRPISPYSLGPGAYVISTTMLNNIYNGRFMGPWRASYEKLYQDLTRDMARLQAAMRDQATLETLLAQEGAEVWKRKVSDFDSLRFGRLCAYLRQREPDERITYGMLVYNLKITDLAAALAGPPAELRSPDAIKGANAHSDNDLDFVK